MLGSSGTLSGVVTDEAPCSGRWVLTKPQTASRVSTASKIRMAASRLRRLSRWVSSPGSFSAGAVSGFMVRASSWVYS